MPNSIGPTGLTVATQAEILANFTTQFEAIYGADINLASDTPDGQMINIFTQAVLDLQDLLIQIYNTFDPDNAIGVILDQRVAINGIQRQAGTYTITNITVVVGQTIPVLYGLDQETNPPYTVADQAGNQWELQTTQNGITPGTYVYAFQSATPGANLTTPGTITVPVSIVLGVTSVNNPTTYTTLGVNEESDAQLKIRRQASVSLGSQGYLAGLLAALENIPGVTAAFVYENNTSTTNSLNIPSHSIWVIVAGSATAENIATAIYNKRNAGCGMYNTGGATAMRYVITQVDGSAFIVYWDSVGTESLFTAFYLTSLNGTSPPNIAAITNSETGLPAIFMPGPNAEVNINQLATLIQQLDPNSLVTFAGSGTPATGGFSTAYNGTYTNTLTPTAPNNQFVVATADIIALPMQLSPYNPLTANPISVVALATQQFTGLGGYSTLTYSLLVNNSGGSVNSSTGLYTAGSTTGVQDTVKVTDLLGNTATALVLVT